MHSSDNSKQSLSPLNQIPGYIDLGELMSRPSQATKWIVEGIIAAHALVALVGDAKSGKSILALELAIAVSTGCEFAGSKTTKTKTLYIDMENNAETVIHDRLHSFGCNPDDLENLIFLSFPHFPPLDTPDGGNFLADLVRRHEVGFVVIDTISRVVDGDENSNDTWNRFYKNTELLLKQEGVALLRIDHTGKDKSKGARGGSAKSGDVDLVIRMTAQRNGKIKLIQDAARVRGGFEILELERLDKPRLHHALISSGSKQQTESRVRKLVELLDQEGYPRGLSCKATRDALQQLREPSSKATSGEVTRRRKELTAESFNSLEDDFSCVEEFPSTQQGHAWGWTSPKLSGTSPKCHQTNHRCLQ